MTELEVGLVLMLSKNLIFRCFRLTFFKQFLKLVQKHNSINWYHSAYDYHKLLCSFRKIPIQLVVVEKIGKIKYWL